MILGHSSLETTMGYVHMGARIHQALKSKLQLERPMNFATDEIQKGILFPEKFGKRFGKSTSSAERSTLLR